MFSAKTAQKRPKTAFYGYLGYVMIHKKGKFIQKSFKHIIFQYKYQQKLTFSEKIALKRPKTAKNGQKWPILAYYDLVK